MSLFRNRIPWPDLRKRSLKIFAAAIIMIAAAFSVLSGVGANTRQHPENEPVIKADSICHTYLRPELRALVDSAANVIADSVGTLMPLMEKLRELQCGGEETVSILHIGDSHVQAGFFTGRLRELFQSDFGDAGRGLIIPHRMARMNEASDYIITSRFRHSATKATDRSDDKPGFTGVAVKLETPYNELTVKSKHPFTTVTVFHAPGAPRLSEPDELSIGSHCTAQDMPTSTRITLSQSTDSLTLSGFTTPEWSDPTFYGFSLENGSPGVLYHAVGLNSAAFEHFANNTTILDGGAAALTPDLIIISLGTNNCYGNNFNASRLRDCANDFIRRLKESYPGVPLLLTTPMESHRRVGGRRSANPNIAVAAVEICVSAADNDVAWWNFYDAAGGAGAMDRWHARGLAQTDRIHLTESGYVLQADMLYEAFSRLYNETLHF